MPAHHSGTRLRPGEPWAGAILYILAPGLLVPFALWLVSRAAGGSWIDADGEWVRPTGRYLILRLAVSGTLLLLALAATLAGLAPFADFMPGGWHVAGNWVLGAFAALLILAILIAAVAGAAIVGGWKGVPAGVLFTAGFCSISTYTLTDGGSWEIAAYGLLAASVAWFYAVGAETGWLPDFHRIVLGHWLTGIASAAALAIGVWFGLGFPAVLGACVLAAWLPLQLPRTQGAAVLPDLGRDRTRPPGRPTKRKPRQRRHQRA
ncbi:hypothetical protein AB0N24_07360 [Arthrobacter sp. NPDC093128]|uniref:hypothetical protein n=1 Tax=Arthrobacter sp. NPDC093128 TaxID=3154979 RepID=UPI003423410B